MTWQFRLVVVTVLISVFASVPGRAQVVDKSVAVGLVLDAFHQAASRADGDRYFGYFADGAVFIGTDATERWSVDEFREFAEPYFSQGRGWTYAVVKRHIQFDKRRETGWFDEILENETYGTCRGTGVLVIENGEWRIAQYHLTIPIPNELAGAVVDMIRERDQRE